MLSTYACTIYSRFSFTYQKWSGHSLTSRNGSYTYSISASSSQDHLLHPHLALVVPILVNNYQSHLMSLVMTWWSLMTVDSCTPEHIKWLHNIINAFSYLFTCSITIHSNSEIMYYTNDMCLYLFLIIMTMTNVRNLSSDLGNKY